MEDLGSDFDLESNIENINFSQSGTPMWWGTKDQELTKLLDDLEPLPLAPMTNLHNTEASQKAYTKQCRLKHQEIRSRSLLILSVILNCPLLPSHLYQSRLRRILDGVLKCSMIGLLREILTWGSKKCPLVFLERADCACNAAMLNQWLTKFVLEGTRRTDGQPYPPDTIYALLCGLYRYMQLLFGEAVPNFLSRKTLLSWN